MRNLQDILVITRRQILLLVRVPEVLIFSTIQPVMFVLLFAFVFGGSINIPGVDYKEWLLPGIMAQTMAFSSFVVAIGLNNDLGKGIVALADGRDKDAAREAAEKAGFEVKDVAQESPPEAQPGGDVMGAVEVRVQPPAADDVAPGRGHDSAAEARKFIHAELAKWTKTVKAAGITSGN
mgnify:CR=1 FL=1